MRIKPVPLFPLLCILGMVLCQPSASEAKTTSRVSWPDVVPVIQTYNFEDGQNAGVELSIKGKSGADLYRLECHTFHYSSPSFTYSGDFHCRLISLIKSETGSLESKIDQYTTLFTEDANQDTDWDNRGRFNVPELEGSCADYPEYGHIRHFLLRGMEITLSIEDMAFKTESLRYANLPGTVTRLASFRFTVKVVPDPDAHLSITQRTQYLYPPKLHPDDPHDRTLDCRQVRTR